MAVSIKALAGLPLISILATKAPIDFFQGLDVRRVPKHKPRVKGEIELRSAQPRGRREIGIGLKIALGIVVTMNEYNLACN